MQDKLILCGNCKFFRRNRDEEPCRSGLLTGTFDCYQEVTGRPERVIGRETSIVEVPGPAPKSPQTTKTSTITLPWREAKPILKNAVSETRSRTEKERGNAIREYFEALRTTAGLSTLVTLPVDLFTCPTDILKQLTKELGNSRGMSR